VLKRLKRVFDTKVAEQTGPPSATPAEDPLAALDRLYDQQVGLLRDVKRSIVEVTAARRRLELRADDARGLLSRFEEQARVALAEGQEARARAALQERQAVAARLGELDRHIAQLDEELERLTANAARMTQRIELFRTRKEVLKARHAAAQAKVRLGEAVAGLGEEAADTGLALQRAEAAAAALRGRGQAVSELLEAGVLGGIAAGDPGAAEFDRLLSEAAVDDELEALRRSLQAPGPARPGGSSA
jgi:phage shock protein A